MCVSEVNTIKIYELFYQSNWQKREKKIGFIVFFCEGCKWDISDIFSVDFPKNFIYILFLIFFFNTWRKPLSLSIIPFYIYLNCLFILFELYYFSSDSDIYVKGNGLGYALSHSQSKEKTAWYINLTPVNHSLVTVN